MSWPRKSPARIDFGYLTDLDFPPGEEDVVWFDAKSSLRVALIGRGTNRHYRLRTGNWMFVDILGENRLLARALAGTARENCDHFLTDQVIPRTIADNGTLVLHAGAVKVTGGAFLLIGESGRGKSTLCASFAGAGHGLLGDDATMIADLDSRPSAEAVYPSLRLLPDSVKGVMPAGSTGSTVADYTEKMRFPVGDEGFEPAPIRAAFNLSPLINCSKVSVSRLDTAEACMIFVENSFALDPSDTKRARDRLHQASELAKRVPAFKLAFPRSYERLPEVRQAILDRVAEMATE